MRLNAGRRIRSVDSGLVPARPRSASPPAGRQAGSHPGRRIQQPKMGCVWSSTPEGPAIDTYSPFLISRCTSDKACVSTVLRVDPFADFVHLD